MPRGLALQFSMAVMAWVSVCMLLVSVVNCSSDHGTRRDLIKQEAEEIQSMFSAELLRRDPTQYKSSLIAGMTNALDNLGITAILGDSVPNVVRDLMVVAGDIESEEYRDAMQKHADDAESYLLGFQETATQRQRQAKALENPISPSKLVGKYPSERALRRAASGIAPPGVHPVFPVRRAKSMDRNYREQPDLVSDAAVQTVLGASPGSTQLSQDVDQTCSAMSSEMCCYKSLAVSALLVWVGLNVILGMAPTAMFLNVGTAFAGGVLYGASGVGCTSGVPACCDFASSKLKLLKRGLGIGQETRQVSPG